MPRTSALDRRKRIGPWLPNRKEAQRLGAKTYNTGAPCNHGHLAPRITSTAACMDCHTDRVSKRKKERRAQDPGFKAREYASTKKWRKANLDHLREYNRKYLPTYRAANPEFVERERLRMRAIRSDNPDYVAREREKGRERYWENPEHFREKSRRRQRAEPETYATYARQRRGRILKAGGTHTKEDVEAINKRQKYKCAECGVSTRYTYDVDHIMPLALGGSTAASNLQILCPTCNRSKSAMHPVDFAKRRGRLV